jgi:RimJ/RimL family protein N-acetyltransferase
VKLVLEPQQAIVDWVAARAHCGSHNQMSGLLYFDSDNRPVAGAAFEDCTGNTVTVHIVCLEPTAFRTLMRGIANYAFGQLGCSRLTLYAESTNVAALELHKRLGAVPEGRLVGASRSGDDILLSRLDRDNRFWRKWNGQQRRVGTGDT